MNKEHLHLPCAIATTLSMAISNINIDVSDLTDAIKKINVQSVRAMRLVDAAVKDTAYDIDNDLKETLKKGSRGGKTYKRGSKTHTASALGEAPKTDTGRLISSIRPITSLMTAEVGSLSNIAKYGGDFEPDRPWISTVNEKYEPLIAQRINKAIVESGIAS